VEFVATDSFDLDKRSRDTLRLKPTPAPTLPPEALEAARHHEKWKAAVQTRAEQLSAGRRILTGSGLVDAAYIQRNAKDAGASSSNARDLGSLVHRLMEIVNIQAPGDLTAYAEAEARGLGLTSADAREAVGLVQRALAHPLIAGRAAHAERLYREVPFAFTEGDTLFEGYADLVFMEKDGPVIVDYKTDSVTESEAEEHARRYAPQAEIYTRAISAALGKPVKEFHFLFIRPAVAVSLAAIR